MASAAFTKKEECVVEKATSGFSIDGLPLASIFGCSIDGLPLISDHMSDIVHIFKDLLTNMPKGIPVPVLCQRRKRKGHKRLLSGFGDLRRQFARNPSSGDRSNKNDSFKLCCILKV